MKTVTISGVDEFTSFKRYRDLFYQFPFCEFGILFAPNKENNRYPSEDWIGEFVKNVPGKKSLHICPSVIRDGFRDYYKLLGWYADADLIDRIQININFKRNTEYIGEVSRFIDNLQDQYKPVILQFNSANKDYLHPFTSKENLQILVDFSGGNGKTLEVGNLTEFESFLKKVEFPIELGLSGGIDSTNALKTVANSLRVDEIGQKRVKWIDAESSLRDNNDEFCISKAIEYLESVEKWALYGEYE